jgi:hypothetical protein
VLVTTAVAEVADTPARAALVDAEAGKLGKLEQRLVHHLAATGPGEIGDLRAELDSVPPVPGCQGPSRAPGSRWDEVFPRAAPGGVVDVLVAFVGAAVAAPEREIGRWLRWLLPDGTIAELVASGRLHRLDGDLIASPEV